MAAICCKACAFPCEVLGKCCKGCKGCAKNTLCSCPENRPNPLHLCFTLVFNIPIAGGGIVAAILGNSKDCDSTVTPIIWGAILSVCAIFFLGYAIHVYILLSKPYNEDRLSQAERGQNEPDLSSFNRRIKYLLCNDPCTCMSFIMYPVTCAWAVVGLADVDDLETENCDEYRSLVQTLSIASIIFLVASLFVALVTCCWEAARVRKDRGSNQGQGQAIPTASLASYMFNTGGRPSGATQAPQAQVMEATNSGPAPVGTAVSPTPGAHSSSSGGNAGKEGILSRMKNAFSKS